MLTFAAERGPEPRTTASKTTTRGTHGAMALYLVQQQCLLFYRVGGGCRTRLNSCEVFYVVPFQPARCFVSAGVILNTTAFITCSGGLPIAFPFYVRTCMRQVSYKHVAQSTWMAPNLYKCGCG